MIIPQRCEHEPQLITEIEGVRYYGADFLGVKEFSGDAIINFTGTSHFPSVAPPKELAEHMYLPSFKEIMVPWPDFGIPQVDMSFWTELHCYILDQGWKDVCFHCQAGHGRTGTALATMLIANEEISADGALWYIRTNYCEHAVETEEQCLYLIWADEYYNDRDCKTELVGSQELFKPEIKENKEDEFQYEYVDDDDNDEDEE